jgi:hypothetical protein
MSYTDLEYALVVLHRLHRYDAFANPDKVGLGRCGCGVDMYFCEHDPHFARALIAELGLTHEVRTFDDGTQVRLVGRWENTPWPSLRVIAERIVKSGRRG